MGDVPLLVCGRIITSKYIMGDEMTPDFFPDKRSKEKKLEEWCKNRKFFSKVDVLRYGLDNFYIRSDRTIREMVREGKVMRIFSPTKTAQYRWVDNGL